jgi:hypothetical protein
MRQWMLAQRQPGDGFVDDVTSVAGKRSVDRAILQRADALGQAEAWQARQIGRSIMWQQMLAKGDLPESARKRWLTEDDELVCPVCGPLHRQEVGLNERFRLPDGRELWAPGVHPNCRCELQLVRPNLLTTMFEKRDDIAKVITPQSRQILRDQSGDLVTPAGRKKVATQVVVTEAELGLRRQKRRLARMDPQHPSVRAALAKARGDDPFDRDTSGRFAATEMRTAPVGRMEVLERPVAEPEVQQEVELDPFAATEPFVDTPTLDPFTEFELGTEPSVSVDPFVAVDPFVDVDPFTPPALGTGTGSGQMIIIINGKPERVPDDELVMAPADYYQGVFTIPIRRADWDVNDRFGSFENTLHGMPPVRGTEAADFGFTVESMRPIQELPAIITGKDVGKVIDFDAWQRRMALHNKDRDFPGFPARRVADHDMLLDVVHHGVDDSSDDWGSDVEEMFYEYRSQAQEAAWNDMGYAVPLLSDEEIQFIFLEAGRSQDVRDNSPSMLREILENASVNGFEDDDDMALIDSYTEYAIQDDETLLSLQAELESRLGGDPGNPFLRVPQIFSFHGGSFRQDRVDGSNEVRVHGKFRIADVRVHSFTREGITIDQHSGKARVSNHQVPNPRVPVWREIVLEPVDE